MKYTVREFMKKLGLLIFFFLGLLLDAKGELQEGYKKPYTIFDADGREIGYEELVKGLSQADVVCIGEIHNCSIIHWLELELTRSLYAIHGDKLMMGAEMFEADNQLILDEYMKNKISYDSFEKEARIWSNYNTDYEPFVYFAKENKIPFIATNVPRRYANMVKNKGLQSLDSLTEEAKRYLPPLPIHFVREEENESMFSMMQMIGGKMAADNTEYLAQAQALKDATMGWFIAKYMKTKFLHFNGNFHTDFGKGIIPYLLEYRPNTKIKTVCSVRQEQIEQIDEVNKGRGDYYICVLEDMTSTY